MTTLDAPAVSALDAATEALQELVVEYLAPGEQLPAEAELAERFGVSRLTMREAVKVLAGRGLLDVARGRRAIVRRPESGVLSDYLAIALRRDPRGLLELTEIRRSLEVLSVGAAARAAAPAGLTAIRDALGRMADAVDADDLDGHHAADLEFHAAVALAGGNRMLALLLESLASCLRESFAESARGHFARGGTMTDDLDAHRRIAGAIAAGDARAAETAMRTHLDEAERDLRAARSARA